MFFLPPTGEESALDGAEQAAPPGVVHVDAAAPWRSEEAAESISQDTQDTQSLLGSCSHLELYFSIRSPVVSRSESRGVFLVVLVTWWYLPRILPQVHETCFMFLLGRMFTSPHPLRRCVGKQTPAAPEVQLHEDLLGSAMSRNCLGTRVSSSIETMRWMFSNPKKKGVQTKKRARNLALASKFRSPRPPKGTHSDRKEGHTGFFLEEPFCISLFPFSSVFFSLCFR